LAGFAPHPWREEPTKPLIKVAGIQMACGEDKERNLDKAEQLVSIAAEKQAQIVCFSELFATRWFPREMNPCHLELAEETTGSTLVRMQELASRYGLVLVCPFFEKGEGGTGYNSAAVIDAGGELLGCYRKVHVPQIPLWEERFYFSPGDLGFPVFKTRYGILGVQICWDIFFPEGPRVLALKGAQLILVPTAAAFASQKRWETMITSNAIANGLFIFRVNRVGSEEKQDFYGSSFCASPEGELLGPPTGIQEAIALAEVDLKQVDRTRKEWPFLKDRRPDIYGEIVAEKAMPFATKPDLADAAAGEGAEK
jgi:N-carbamoylputrescine amidase